MDEQIKLHNNLIYVWGYVMLPKNLAIAPTITIQNTKFVAKKELMHVSIINTKNYVSALATKLNLTESEACQKLVSEIDSFVSYNPIDLESLSDEVRIVKKSDRVSLIIMVKITNINKLYEHLKSIFQIDFEPQPTHITLYTLENGVNIGVDSQKDLDLLSTKLNMEDTKAVLDSIS